MRVALLRPALAVAAAVFVAGVRQAGGVAVLPVSVLEVEVEVAREVPLHAPLVEGVVQSRRRHVPLLVRSDCDALRRQRGAGRRGEGGGRRLRAVVRVAAVVADVGLGARRRRQPREPS